LKILIVTQYFWPENFRINDMAAQLQERGHEVTVLTGLPNYPSGKLFPGYGYFSRHRETFQNVSVIRFPHFPRGNCGFFGMAACFLSFALMGSLLAPWLLRGKVFDVIFVYEPSPITVGFPAVVMRALRKIPLVFWVQDLWPESLTSAGNIHSPWILKPVERMVKFLYRHFDRILVTSRGFIPSVLARGAVVKQVEYYPQSAEKIFRPVEVPENAEVRRLLPKGFVVLFGGNIGVSQDFPTILAAAEALRERTDIHWIIIGSGRMEGWVKSQVAHCHLERTVHLLGRFPVESMPQFYACADVVLVTLKRDPIYAVTLPAKIQAYMACGRPILAALEGEGAHVVVESGCGVVVPSGDAKSLAKAVEELASAEKGTLQRMGERGRAYCATHFEFDHLLGRLEEILCAESRKALAKEATR